MRPIARPDRILNSLGRRRVLTTPRCLNSIMVEDESGLDPNEQTYRPRV